jgi:hypothetical protein
MHPLTSSSVPLHRVHAQVWALQQGSSVYLVGRSNRSKVLFEQELDGVMDAVPELEVAVTQQ